MTPIELRESIPALEDVVYFNTGAGGPSPRPVVDAFEDAVERHEYEAPTRGATYEVAFESYESSRASIADFLGVGPDSIALTNSTADGIARVAGAIDWQEGDVVVRTDLEHPAGILPWQRLERELGVEVRVLETEAGRLDLEDVSAAVEDARLICLSTLTWTHGTRLPVEEVVDVAHEAGAAVLLDAVQEPGQRPVDVGEWGAEFVVGAGHKWLLGPFGAGYLYVRPGAEEGLVPSAIGYRSVEEPTAETYRYATGARRFEVGTISPAPHAGLAAATETIEAVGLDRIEGRIERLTDRLKAGISDERLLSPRAFESGLVTVDVAEPEATVDRLADAGIVVRALPYPEAIRISVHAFNTAEDVDALLEVL